MPHLIVPLSAEQTLRRIEEYSHNWKGDRVPGILRDKRVSEIKLQAISGFRFTLRFSLDGNNRKPIVRYCEGVVEPTAGGSRISWSLRGALTPVFAVSAMGALVVVNVVYELVTGGFDRFTAVFAVVAPAIAGTVALLEKRMIANNFGPGMAEALRTAVADTETQSGNSSDATAGNRPDIR